MEVDDRIGQAIDNALAAVRWRDAAGREKNLNTAAAYARLGEMRSALAGKLLTGPEPSQMAEHIETLRRPGSDA